MLVIRLEVSCVKRLKEESLLVNKREMTKQNTLMKFTAQINQCLSFINNSTLYFVPKFCSDMPKPKRTNKNVC